MTSHPQGLSSFLNVSRLRKLFWDQAEKGACHAFHLALRLKAKPMNETMRQLPALVLAPHADDETLGCGGVIALKRKAGTDVTIAIATDGSASHGREKTVATTPEGLIALRETETRAACEILGAPSEHVRFMQFQDSKLEENIPALGRAIAEMIAETQPSEVYVCAQRDGHPDHVALAKAARLAMNDAANTDRVLYEYPVWSFNFRSWRDVGKTNTVGFLHGCSDMIATVRRWPMVSVNIAGVVATKRRALAAHKSQLGSYAPEPHWSGLPQSFLVHFFQKKEVFRVVDLAREEA